MREIWKISKRDGIASTNLEILEYLQDKEVLKTRRKIFLRFLARWDRTASFLFPFRPSRLKSYHVDEKSPPCSAKIYANIHRESETIFPISRDTRFHRRNIFPAPNRTECIFLGNFKRISVLFIDTLNCRRGEREGNGRKSWKIRPEISIAPSHTSFSTLAHT